MIHLPFQAVNHRSCKPKTRESDFQSGALANVDIVWRESSAAYLIRLLEAWLASSRCCFRRCAGDQCSHCPHVLRERFHEFLCDRRRTDRKSTRLNSSHANISYAVFCLKKKKTSNDIFKETFTALYMSRTHSVKLHKMRSKCTKIDIIRFNPLYETPIVYVFIHTSSQAL